MVSVLSSDFLLWGVGPRILFLLFCRYMSALRILEGRPDLGSLLSLTDKNLCILECRTKLSGAQ